MDFGLEGGFRFAGTDYARSSFETVFACDIDSAAKSVYDAYSEAAGRKARLTLASIVDIVENHASSPLLPEYADVLTGGFPCTDFSHAGKRMGFGSKKNHMNEYGEGPSRGTLYQWMCKAVGIVKPKVVIAENVKGLMTTKNALSTIRADFKAMGYYVTSILLDASNFGVPQRRERVIIFGFREDALTEEGMEFVEPQIGKEDPIYPPFAPRLFCGKALSDLKEPGESDNLDQQAYSKAAFLTGKKVATLSGEEPSKGGKQGKAEVDLHSFAATIRSEHHGNIEFRRLAADHGGTHAEELEAGLPERRLTVRECARLQSFPDEYRFLPLVSAAEAYVLIGNAVPPVLAWHLGNRLESIWGRLFGENHG